MTYRCSFCGKGQDQAQRLIAGPGGVYICDECVDLCREIIAEQATAQPAAAQRQLQHLLNGSRVTQIIAVAARLGIADALADGPKTAEELAAATGAHADALYRVLRALASLNVFEEVAPRRFALTPLAMLLQADHPNSMRAWAIMSGEEPYRAWSDLLHSVMTGAPAFEHVYGAPRFDYLAQHPEASALFNQSMSENSRRAAAAILAAYDFPKAGTVVDVGGGQGILLTSVLRAHLGLRGVLFDQPQVVAEAMPILEDAGMAERCALVGGDFFSSPFPAGDLYLLRRVLHDWDDKRSVAILRQCAQAMAPGGKALGIESVITPGNEASWAKFLDLQMLVMTGGRERTEEEYRQLFAAAGLRLTRTIPTDGEASLLEGERSDAAPGR